MKRTALRKRGKSKTSAIQRELWELCKQITRKTYGNNCYTCNAKGLIGSDWQTGHMWAKAALGASMKYDVRILRPQCAKCNRWNDGMGADFYARMLREKGPEYMANLQKDRQVNIRDLGLSADDFYLLLIPAYQEILGEIDASLDARSLIEDMNILGEISRAPSLSKNSS